MIRIDGNSGSLPISFNGASMEAPNKCPQCGSTAMQMNFRGAPTVEFDCGYAMTMSASGNTETAPCKARK